MSTENRKGGISVEAEHIFPVIKKWLYSDKEIFLREIVSNAVDAETKLKRLVSLGEVKDIDVNGLAVTVTLDSELKTITVTDNGIGMTEEEIQKYICSIAISGALDFIKKYEGEGEGSKGGIIGHFGLGFYSAFMVADKVEVITRSYTGTPAMRWVCDASGQYEMEEYYGDAERGTSVTMYIGDEGKEYLAEAQLRSVLTKYCSYLPVPVYFESGEEEKDGEDKEKTEKTPINDTHPLWLKAASECTEEEYKEFYRKAFSDWREPLLTVHINADYPLNFKGILFFPRHENEFENMEGQVKLYYNQMFVADNIKEVIPENFLMLRGVLDCPELPLNVSRSYLQNNTYVKKIAAHITKKVADRLVYMKENEREKYEKIWDDIKAFAEYSCICDTKFRDRAGDAMLLKLNGGGYKTVAEYLESAKEKHENKVYYANDPAAQAQYISMFEKQGIEVVLFERFVDTQFMAVTESAFEGVKFIRVDADIADALKSGKEVKTEKNEELEKLFCELSGNEKLNISYESLADDTVPAILNLSEEARRFEDAMKMYSSMGMPGMTQRPEETLCLNMANQLAAELAAKKEFGEKDKLIAKQLYSLATLAQRRFEASELQKFLSESYSILGMLKD